jgi:phosphonate transport system substrate-binding protein
MTLRQFEVFLPVYFTDVVVRRDDAARTFADLHDRVWAYNAEGSHSGHNVVRHHPLALGETGGYVGRVVAAGSHQNSIRMVLDREIDASGIDSTVLELERARQPELEAALRTIATIGPSPIPPVVMARGLDSVLKTRVANCSSAWRRSLRAASSSRRAGWRALSPCGTPTTRVGAYRGR